MGKVIRLNKKITKSATTFTDMLDRDICNLSDVAGISKEQAIQMASDFYRKYPMLIEHVRSPEYMMRNK